MRDFNEIETSSNDLFWFVVQETSDVVLRDHSTQPSAYQRLSLAESVEELEENGHTESWNDQPDEWNDQVDHLASSANPYIGQDTGNLETVAEEDGTNLVAIALYDYQAGADDELSFDPDDIITNIEMVKFSDSIYFNIKFSEFKILFAN